MKRLSVAALLGLLSSCSPSAGDGATESSDDYTQVSYETEANPVNACGVQETYDIIKEIVFDQVVEKLDGDPVPVNDLRRSVAVSMKYPRLSGVQSDLDRTDCSGRLVLGLPPIAREAFGGDPELKADIEYSVQPAADGSGDIVTVNGIGYIVQQILAADNLRTTRKLASQGEAQLRRTFNPSFNCGANLNNTERMICQDEGLARLDQNLSDAFKQKLAGISGPDRTILLASQRAALAERAECPDTDCLYRWYNYQLSTY